MHQRRVFFFLSPSHCLSSALKWTAYGAHIRLPLSGWLSGLGELPWPFIIRVTLILTLVNLQKSIYISR